MKSKPALIILVLLAICSFFVFPVFAQQEIEDYSFQHEKYRGHYDNYTKARETHFQYQTLSSQAELIKASQEFLYSRAIVIRTYLQALKFLLRGTIDVIPEQKSQLILSLDREVGLLEEYEKQVQNLQNPTFDDLLEISKRLERNEFAYKKLAYQTLSNILVGKMRALQSESGAINFLLSDQIEKNGEGRNKEMLNQWLQTVRDMNYRSQQNIVQAEAYLNQLNNSGGKDSLGLYQEIQGELEKARLTLVNTIQYQREILREVGDE